MAVHGHLTPLFLGHRKRRTSWQEAHREKGFSPQGNLEAGAMLRQDTALGAHTSLIYLFQLGPISYILHYLPEVSAIVNPPEDESIDEIRALRNPRTPPKVTPINTAVLRPSLN